jgi:serine phosphatase RsbU (regulator of sigma subunit)
VDADRGVVQWASGGHPAALLRRADGSLEELHSTAMVLGVLEDDEFRPEPAELPFRPGDAIVAFTDGACEARDPSGRMLGAAAIRRLVEEVTGAADGSATRDAAEWPVRVLTRLVAYREAPPEDDTLVACVYRPVV